MIGSSDVWLSSLTLVLIPPTRIELKMYHFLDEAVASQGLAFVCTLTFDKF